MSISFNLPGVRAPKAKGNKKQKFEKVDDFDREALKKLVYGFYSQKAIPTLGMILFRAKKELNFSYSESTLQRLLKELGFKYKKYERRLFILDSPRLKIWRFEYLELLDKYRNTGYRIVYLDETWFDTHEVASKGWMDRSGNCVAEMPPSRGKRLIILHVGGEDGFVENGLLISAKDIKSSCADYHQDMDSELFEKWFQSQLLPSLGNTKTAIVMDNASYHSR